MKGDNNKDVEIKNLEVDGEKFLLTKKGRYYKFFATSFEDRLLKNGFDKLLESFKKIEPSEVDLNLECLFSIKDLSSFPIPIPFEYATLRTKSNGDFSISFFKFIDFHNPEWNKKWELSFFIDEVKKISINDKNIKVIRKKTNTWMSFNFFLITVAYSNSESKSIHELLQNAVQKIINYCDKVEEKIDSKERIRKIIDIWENEKYNKEEEFWQNFFTANSWIISHSLSEPEILFTSKAYLGGKSLKNQGGKIIDFLFQSQITENLTLIEIKTPNTKLIGESYRSNHSISKELTGSIIQLLDYKETILKSVSQHKEAIHESFELFSPKMILIVGSTESLSKEQLYSFELLRREMKNVEIITYNELFKKIKNLYELIK